MARIFISHRGVDSQKAKELAIELKAAGHEIWLDAWEIKVGDSVISKMNSGLTKCDVVILCVSSAGVDAGFIALEWMSTLARHCMGCSIKLITVLFGGGADALPAILSDKLYVNLDEDWCEGISELIDALSDL